MLAKEKKDNPTIPNAGLLKIMSASRYTDPAFYAQSRKVKTKDGGYKTIEGIIPFLERNAKLPIGDPRRVYAIEIWTKHDGQPLANVLKACKQYKVAPMVSFSISTLGDSALEKGVLKYTDMLRLIKQLIIKGYLNPATTTIRIDPILPGVTNMDSVKHVIEYAKKLGIKKYVTSLV
jgi:hypothetical protein